MNLTTKQWLKLSIFNLTIVTLLGLIMRYKIEFPLSFIDQKHLQHAHSHFAFTAWISHTIYVLIGQFLIQHSSQFNTIKFNRLISYNIFTAYGMLISFILQGYGLISITFSTLNILISYAFAISIHGHLKPIQHPAKPWINAALIFSVLSSIGTFILAYMMTTKSFSQSLYLASVYFYLHFQYNAWFIFSCFGLLVYYLNLMDSNFKLPPAVFILFAVTCIPAYGLSVLWLKLPLILQILIAIAATLQLVAWTGLFKVVYQSLKRNKEVPSFIKYIALIIGLAYTSKLLLQLGSTIPSISQMAFGFRPIVIAYLHLVLLCVISLTLVLFIIWQFLNNHSTSQRFFVIALVATVFINEIVIGIQGIASLSYTLLPYANVMLIIIAIFILISTLGVFFTSKPPNISAADK